MPFAPGTSAAWMSGSLKVTWSPSAGNANAPPIVRRADALVAAAAASRIARASSRSASGSGASSQATRLALFGWQADPQAEAERLAERRRTKRPTDSPLTRRMTSPDEPAVGDRVIGVPVPGGQSGPWASIARDDRVPGEDIRRGQIAVERREAGPVGSAAARGSRPCRARRTRASSARRVRRGRAARPGRAGRRDRKDALRAREDDRRRRRASTGRPVRTSATPPQRSTTGRPAE